MKLALKQTSTQGQRAAARPSVPARSVVCSAAKNDKQVCIPGRAHALVFFWSKLPHGVPRQPVSAQEDPNSNHTPSEACDICAAGLPLPALRVIRTFLML